MSHMVTSGTVRVMFESQNMKNLLSVERWRSLGVNTSYKPGFFLCHGNRMSTANFSSTVDIPAVGQKAEIASDAHT